MTGGEVHLASFFLLEVDIEAHPIGSSMATKDKLE
jgi:hypothetical protein